MFANHQIMSELLFLCNTSNSQRQDTNISTTFVLLVLGTVTGATNFILFSFGDLNKYP